jgi:cytochrome c peroxidase
MIFERPFPFCLVLLSVPTGAAAQTGRDASPPDPPLGLPPAIWPADDPYSAAHVELGRNLFFDRRLSSNGRISRATCHPPEHAFAGGRPLPLGVTGTPLRGRAPALMNRAYGRSQFVDGRAPTLEAQNAGPIAAPDEMGTTPLPAAPALAIRT